MSWSRFLTIGLLGTIGGIFGDLLAAIIEHSLGRFTLLQAVATSAGVIAVILLTGIIERWSRRDTIKSLLEKLAYHREQLRSLEEWSKSGDSWTFRHDKAWHDHQDAIEDIVSELKARGENVEIDPIDYALPPPTRTGFLIKLFHFLKRHATLLAVPVILGVAFAISPFGHHCYLNYVATPTPRPTSTISPLPITPSPRPPVTQTPMVTATPTQRPTSTPTFTPTASDTPISTPMSTPTATDTPISTPTPPPTATDTPISIPTPPPTFETYIDATNTPLPAKASTSMPPPTFEPSPMLIEPEAGASFFAADQIHFKWDYSKELRDNEYFAVNLWHVGIPLEKHAFTWVKKRDYILTLDSSPIEDIDFSGGYYYWSVAVILQTGTDPAHNPNDWKLIAESEFRRIYINVPPPMLSPPPP